ncbi:heavy-metal-associated domain-containing protein [Niabella ginsengisoli]|uniref:Heavy-metal-associated domain-containing protein n=1 Tax=Niabella ginsengisoli TaxID=522298 RepID=A0ABS9SNY5_9BACT|nr:heavy-metal-associated domain-containing protein [Niabella ginsengisoli]MCH5600075.1 heavy-metal-associated domain-containing protein [Niabella ginsengisoli]
MKTIKNKHMKTIQLFLFASLFTLVSNTSFAQTQKTEKFKVSGNCGMCKKTIEKAAKDAGASYASWNKDLKELTVKYQSKSTDVSKIQQKVADAGYDNAGAKASDKAYENLPGCCQYDREAKKSTAKK